jgi:uncharacterized protein YdeI (YjbR/CyaY-like superfamily)
VSSSDETFLPMASRRAWRAWLQSHHRSAPAVWIVIDKAAGTASRLTVDEAQEEALCFGWIDVKGRRVDASRFAIRFTPRRARSAWSIVNIRRAETLIAAGQMTPAGMEAIEQAQRNGEWALGLQSADTETIPATLQAALRRKKGALAAYRALSASRQRQILRSVLAAKTTQTQQRRIHAVVDSLSEAGR